jgi:hypothetical protein
MLHPTVLLQQLSKSALLLPAEPDTPGEVEALDPHPRSKHPKPKNKFHLPGPLPAEPNQGGLHKGAGPKRSPHGIFLLRPNQSEFLSNLSQEF